MFVSVFEFRSSYCVARTLCAYLKMTDAVQASRYWYRNISIKSISTQTCARNNTNVEVNSDMEKLESSNTKRKLHRPSREILDYMHSKESLKSTLNFLPEKILKRKRGYQEPIYTVDSEVAKEIANAVADSIQRNIPTFEINPGIGILSKELLLAGINNLHLCEPSYTFNQQIQILLTDFPTQVQLIGQDLLSLSKLTYLDKLDGGSRVQHLFADVSIGNWTDDPVMIIIGTLPSLSFIKHLIHCFIHQIGILSYGRPELYVLMAPRHYFTLTCRRDDGYMHYRSVSVLFQLIFQWNVLMKLPRKAFLPWEAKYSPKKWSKLQEIRSIDFEFMYLVKIVPHRNFFEKVVKVEQLHEFWYFILHHMSSRKNRVIPQLEKWVPGCGPRLISHNMTIYTEFGDLTPQQILSLFHEFSSWPEYPDCSFLSSMESMLSSVEQSVGDDIDVTAIRDVVDEGDGVEDENIAK